MKRATLSLGCMLVALGAYAQENEIQSPINGHYYSLIPQQVNPDAWNALQTIAEENGGNLVTIRSVQENQWLVDTFGPLVPGGSVYIGLNDIDTEGDFVWASGEPVAYTNWNAGEPNNSGNEDAAEMNTVTGGWNDNGINRTQPAIMERRVFEFRTNPSGGGFVIEGADVTLSAEAWGNGGPIVYQWRKNGTDIMDATSTTLVLNDVTAADNGSYVLSADDGTKTAILSAPATITVVAPGSLPVGGIIAGALAMVAVGAAGVAAMRSRRKH
jgi:hypothetical protein